MAISFGRRGTGGGSGVQAVFLEEHQSGSASPSNATWTGLDTHTPAWQIGDRATGKAAISFGAATTTGWTSTASADIDYQVRVMARTSANATGPWTTEVPVQIVAGEDIAYRASQHTSLDTTTRKNLSAYIPFALSDLPNTSDFADGRYVQFGLSVAIDSSPSPSTITVEDAYLSFTSFGSGYGVPPALSIGTAQIADGAVTRPKIAADAVDGTKIADDAIGSEHLAAGAVDSTAIASGAVTGAKVASSAITGGKIASSAVSTAKIAGSAVTGEKIADGTIEPKHLEGLSNDALNADALVAFSDTGDSFQAINPAAFPTDGSITTAKLADNAVTSAKIADGAVGTDDLADDAVTGDKIASGAVGADALSDGAVGTTQLAGNAVTNAKVHDDAITPIKLSGISTPSLDAGKHIAIDSLGTGFVAVDGGAGGSGGISSVDPSNLDGVSGGSGDGDKFIKTNADGSEFEAVDLSVGDLGVTEGSAQAGKVLAVDTSGTGFQALSAITPAEMGLNQGAQEAGKVLAYNTLGNAFEAVSPASGGVAPTLANITGILNTTKGGTGINATDLADLRSKLGITNDGTGGILGYAKDANTQKDLTILHTDSSTANVPTGVEDGIVIRIGNDQLVINFADGRQWKREITDNNDGQWSEPADDTTLTALSTETQFRTLAEGGRGFTTSTTWLPHYTDGSQAQKVIIGRNGDYLVAINRHNFWWAPRPVVPTWSSIPWRWETSEGAIPAGLVYSGGEKDEEHIPAGEDAVLGGQSGIDGEDAVNALVDHQVSGTTSVYTAYFINDDASLTLQTASNTRGVTAGSWSRVKTDAAGIDDAIVANDRVTDRPVMVADTGALNAQSFQGYTAILSGTPSDGNVLYNANTRYLRIRPRVGDEHLNAILQIGLDIAIVKDASNYARGIIENVAPIGGSTDLGLTLRASDFGSAGSIAQTDTINITTRGIALNNVNSLRPVNLGLSHGASAANKFVAIDSTGQSFVAVEEADGGVIAPGSIDTAELADDAVTNAKLAANAVGTTQIANGAITGVKFGDGSVTHPKIAAEAIEPDNLKGLTNTSANADMVVGFNSTGDGFIATEGGSGGGASSFDDLTGINPTTKGGTGINASDLTDLRSKLGVDGSGSVNPADQLLYSNDAKTQKNNTIHRVDSSTANIPTGVGDGIITRVGNDQFLTDLESAKQWRRSLTTTNDGTWTTPSSATLTELSTAAQFVALADGGRGFTTTATWLPRFTDNSQPSKVIVGRKGAYLIAIDRNNMWWANRITSNSATFISWQWEGNSRIPDGLIYTGGENDEEHIPAGEDAVLSGKTGIDGDNYITVLVNHTATSSTLSTYTAWFLDDDNAGTIQTATNTRGYAEGTWARTRLDLDGISTDIFVPDTDADGNERPAFVGVVPAISDLHFGGYTYKTGLTGIAEGDVAYIPASRVVWIYHKTGDIHLPNLFAIDYEVSIHKDDSNYIRGVFNAVRTFNLGGGVTLSGAEFRADDLDETGTIASGDDVSVRGHKAVLTKTDTIEPVNLGLSHGSGVANQAVLLNSTGDGFTTGSVVSDVADGSITSAKLADGAVTAAKLANGAVTGSAGNTGITSAATYTRTTSRFPGDGQVYIGATEIEPDWRSADSELQAEWEKVGAVVEVEDASGNVMRGTVQSFPGTGSVDPIYTLTDVTGYSGLDATGAFTLRSVASSASKIAGGSIHTPQLADKSVTWNKISGINSKGAIFIDGERYVRSESFTAISGSYTRNLSSADADGEFYFRSSLFAGSYIAVNWKSTDDAASDYFRARVPGAGIRITDASGNYYEATIGNITSSGTDGARYDYFSGLTDESFSGTLANTGNFTISYSDRLDGFYTASRSITGSDIQNESIDSFQIERYSLQGWNLDSDTIVASKIEAGAVQGGNVGVSVSATRAPTNVGLPGGDFYLTNHTLEIDPSFTNDWLAFAKEAEKVGARIEIRDSNGNTATIRVLSVRPSADFLGHIVISHITSTSSLNATGSFTLRTLADDSLSKIEEGVIAAREIKNFSIGEGKIAEGSIRGEYYTQSNGFSRTTSNTPSSLQIYISTSQIVVSSWTGLEQPAVGDGFEITDPSDNTMTGTISSLSSDTYTWGVSNQQGFSGLDATGTMNVRLKKTGEIADNTITGKKFADNSITNAKLAAGALTPAKLQGAPSESSDGIISWSAPTLQYATQTGLSYRTTYPTSNGQIAYEPGNSRISIQGTAPSLSAGDTLEIFKTGASIQITISSIASSFGVTRYSYTATPVTSGSFSVGDSVGVRYPSGMNPGSFAVGPVPDDSVVTDSIANNAVTADKINAAAVTAAKIGTGAVTSSAISTLSITPNKLNNITTGNAAADKYIGLDSTGNNFELKDGGGGGGGGSGAPGVLRLAEITGNTNVTNTLTSSTNPQTFSESVYTPAYEMSDRANASGVFYFNAIIRHSSTSNQNVKANVQVRWADTESAVTSATNWANCTIFNGESQFLDDDITSEDRNENRTFSIAVPFEFADFPSGVTDGKWLQLRVSYAFSKNGGTDVVWSRSGDRSYGFQVIGGGSSSGGSGASAISQLDSTFSVLENYRFQADVSGGVNNNRFGYTESGDTGQLAFNLDTDDVGKEAEFVVGKAVVLYKDDSNYVYGVQTGNTQIDGNDTSEGAFAMTQLRRVGSFADGDSNIKLYYGGDAPPTGVAKVKLDGEFETGFVQPASLDIPMSSTNANRIVTLNSSATGFEATPFGGVGITKAVLVCRQRHGGNDNVMSNVNTTGKTFPNSQGIHTGTWTLQNKSTDWMKINASGLYWFGSINPGPVICDLELLVRWKSGTQTYNSWQSSRGVTNRVLAVDTGTDRLQTTKLFAGGSVNWTANPPSASANHVDMQVPSGSKMVPLSVLDSNITDGTDVQFTVFFKTQTGSPDYQVRNFFLTIEIIDGSQVYENT